MAKQASGGFANMSQGDKVKLIAASAVLVIAVIWIVAYSFSGGKQKPTIDPAEVAKVEEATKQEKVIQDKQQQDTLGRGGRPVPPPSGS
ncbi:MAG: hypothetical protein AB7G11_13625 [Phycisphaerales bacterium]